jgi:hypothetical protein
MNPNKNLASGIGGTRKTFVGFHTTVVIVRMFLFKKLKPEQHRSHNIKIKLKTKTFVWQQQIAISNLINFQSFRFSNSEPILRYLIFFS